MKALTLKLLLFLPLLLVVMAVDYRIDPAKLFQGDQYAKGIAGLLNQGKCVAISSNYNERLLQKYWIGPLEKRPTLVILGSSRVMLADRKLFDGEDTINNGVSGATLEDLIAVYSLYESKKFAPDKIILGLDPWMLNDRNGDERWGSLREEFAGMCPKLKVAPWKKSHTSSLRFKIGIFKQIVSPGYFQESLRMIPKMLASKESAGYFPLDAPDERFFTKLPDGSIHYEREFADVTVDRVDDLVDDYVRATPVYMLGNYEEISKEYLNLLDRFVEYLRNNSVQVQFLLMPYHPRAYDYFVNSPQYKIILKAEECFRVLAEKYGVPVSGSYNPAACKLGREDFYDAMHCKEAATAAILRRVPSTPGRLNKK